MRQKRSGASRSLGSDKEHYKYVLLQNSEARADVSLRRRGSYNNHYNNSSHGKATLRDVKACTIVQGMSENAYMELTQCLYGTYLVLTQYSPTEQDSRALPQQGLLAEYLTLGRPWNAQIDRESCRGIKEWPGDLRQRGKLQYNDIPYSTLCYLRCVTTLDITLTVTSTVTLTVTLTSINRPRRLL